MSYLYRVCEIDREWLASRNSQRQEGPIGFGAYVAWFVCTLPRGHDGPHVRHGSNGRFCGIGEDPLPVEMRVSAGL